MTAIYPTRENPAFGSFVRTQAEALKRAGIGVEVLVLKGRNRKLIYPKGVSQLRNQLKWGLFDLVPCSLRVCWHGWRGRNGKYRS